jgi:hypothetical protein
MAGVSIWLSDAFIHRMLWTACSLLQLSTFSSLLLSDSPSIPEPLAEPSPIAGNRRSNHKSQVPRADDHRAAIKSPAQETQP